MTIFVTLIDRMGQFVDDIVDYANKSFNPQMVIDGLTVSQPFKNLWCLSISGIEMPLYAIADTIFLTKMQKGENQLNRSSPW